jgi:glycosyltransferase involved in cell wall biosynthesis
VLADCRWYSLKEQLFLPFIIRKQKLNLIHFPHFNVPLFCFCPFVVTVHDLILKRFPTRRASTLSFFNYYLKNLAYRLVIFFAVKRAEKIITVSCFTKKDILNYFKIKPEKVKVIYEGAPKKVSSVKYQVSSVKTLDKFGINKPYLLYVGNAYPHKNLEGLLKSFEKLIRRHRMNLQLVLVGELDYFYKRLMNRVAQKHSKISDRIIFTDYVADKELGFLYQNASLYIFPSMCEGFGLPPLEAMSCGVPVVCSNATCLPEVLGEASVYFNPYKSAEIAQVIKRVLGDTNLQQHLRECGFRKTDQYSWFETAKQTLKVYENINKN